MKLTKEQLMAGARSVATEQMSELFLSGSAPLVVTSPSDSGGWSATKNGTYTTLDESRVIIRALVLIALEGEEE